MIDPELDKELESNGFHIEDEDTESYANDAERDFFTAEYEEDESGAIDSNDNNL